KLGLTGLKLYPMYDHYAVNDRDLAFPIFDMAQQLNIPVMIHLSTTPVSDTVLMYGWPVLLDDVARAFPDLRLLVAHTGFPWVDECLVLGAASECLDGHQLLQQHDDAAPDLRVSPAGPADRLPLDADLLGDRLPGVRVSRYLASEVRAGE